MAVPRSEVVDDTCSGEYHCYDRCVRRYRLLSSDDDHRRNWLVDQLHHLAGSFAVDTVSVAVMDNHMHTILRSLPEVVETWSDREVAYRWLLIRPNRTRRRRMGLPLDGPPQEVELDLLCGEPGRIDILRSRLSSVSWFMKEFKEPIARRANREDGTDGRFWQDRFKCDRLLDDAGVLNCATYIDMNPVAAGMSDDALTASFTSVQEHMRRMWKEVAESEARRDGTAEPTMEELLAQLDQVEFTPAIPCRREPYLVEEAQAEREVECAVQDDDDQAARAANAVDPDAAVSSQPIADAAADARPKRRRIPPEAVLGMSLGAYLRRLAEVSRLTTERRAAKSTVRPDQRDPARRAVGLDGLAQAVLDGVDRSLETLSTLAQCARFWGTAIGSSESLGEEAVRRRRHRVVCGLR